MSQFDVNDDFVKVSTRDFASFKYLLRYATPFRAQLISALALLVVASALVVGSARLLGELIEKGLKGHNAPLAYKIGAAVLTLELLSVAATYLGRRHLAAAAIATVQNIRSHLFEKLERLPMSYFDRQPLGRTVTRITYDVEGLEEFFSGVLARLISAFLSLTMVVSAMLVTNFKLGLVLIVAIIPSVLATYFYRKPVRDWNREFARRNSTINAKLSELLNGLPVIRSFGAENWSKQKFDAAVDHYQEAAVMTNVVNSWARPVTMALCQLPLLLLIGLGSRQVLAGTLGLGIFVSFVRYCERFSRPVVALAQEIHTIQIAFTSAERITTFLNHPSEEIELGPQGEIKPSNLQGEIVFDQVTMSYTPGAPVLKNISFRVEPGESIGLAGATGSGKSTTLALLARLYEFQSGDIRIDGIPIRQFNREALRSQIAFVSQDVVIFKGKLRDNLRFGSEGSDEKLLQACQRTGLLHRMHEAGLNLDSLILDQGANLSVGEKQLISLTRVLIKNPSILILDEATANVDAAVEVLIYKAIAEAMQGRSCFIIAHRLATLRDCHKIFLFKNGEIIESGSHDSLMAQNGYYAQLNAQHMTQKLDAKLDELL